MMRTTSGSLFDLAPGGVYKLSRLPERLVVSYTTLSALLVICVSKSISGLLSVALSISLWIPPVRRHLVLRCSDFPLWNSEQPLDKLRLSKSRED